MISARRWNWVLACSLLLAACGGGGSGATPGAPAPAPAPAPEPPSDPAAIPAAVEFPARANDIEWSERHQLLYLALPASNGTQGNTVVALDPRTNQVVHSRRSCSEPAEMALSDDNQYLHVACNGSSSVQRFRLPELTPDREFFLGRDDLGIPYRANDIVAVPGQPKSVVVAMHIDPYVPSPSKVRVYDDGTARPIELGAVTGGDCWSLGWDATRTRLLCAKTSNSGFALQEAVLAADGLRAARVFMGAFRYFYARMAVDPARSVVYGDDGTVFDSVDWRLLTRTDKRGPVAPDSVRNRIYAASSTEGLVRSFDARTLALTSSVGRGSSQPTRLIRWGTSGLALATASNSTLIHGGSGASSFDASTPRGTGTDRIVPVEVKQLVWDPAHALIYASVGSRAAQYANSIVVIEPFSGRVTQSRVVGSEPNALAVSDDGRFLYVGIDGEGSVRRLRLPSLDVDVSISLGERPFYRTPYTAGVIRVLPLRSETIAVTRLSLDTVPSQIGGVVLFDDAVQRPGTAEVDPRTLVPLNHFDIVWNEDGSSLYSLGIYSDLMSLGVTAGGVSLGARLGQIANVRGALHFDKVNRLLSTDGGNVVDAATALPIGTYRPAYNIGGQNVALDPAGAEVFTLAQSATSALRLEITAYDASRFVRRKIYAITGSDVSITFDFVQLRPGWFSFRSIDGVHVIQLAP